MYRDSKWAKEIISLQREDGSWGCFHTLSAPDQNPITTEQALRRLQILGYTIDDTCIQRAVQYMHDCLIGKKETPDRREKIHDWDIFTQLMLSAWIRRFTKDDASANAAADTWAAIISFAFRDGVYSHENYLSAYRQAFAQKARGGRLVDFVTFYQVSLVADCLDRQTERAVFDHILNHETGIYYVYNGPVRTPPEVFASRKASRYMRAIELLTAYQNNLDRLAFVAEWLHANKGTAGKWDMGRSAKDRISFPLSDLWNKEARRKDCTYRIERLIYTINSAQ